jgi:hypothetical protein
MRQITAISNEYKQTFKFPISGYDSVQFTLEFKPNQYSWFMSIVWGTFILNNDHIAVSNNLLAQFKNIIPFGVSVYGPDYVDPFSVDAWISGWTFNILDSTEI